MTPQCHLTIMAALREYKRENLAKARQITTGVGYVAGASVSERQKQFEACMAIDDAVELAMQEIVVAQ